MGSRPAVSRLVLLAMNRIQIFGIDRANNPLLPAMRGLYALDCPTWGAPWQVSGHFHSGTEPLSLSSSSSLHHQRNNSEAPSLWLSRSKENTSRLKGAIVCTDRMPQAADWRICAPNGSGHRRLWRHGSNVGDTTSAGKWWPKLSWACAGSVIYGSSVSKRRLAFPSSFFSRRKFRIRTLNSPNLAPRHCPILILQKTSGANAKN